MSGFIDEVTKRIEENRDTLASSISSIKPNYQEILNKAVNRLTVIRNNKHDYDLNYRHANNKNDLLNIINQTLIKNIKEIKTLLESIFGFVAKSCMA